MVVVGGDDDVVVGADDVVAGVLLCVLVVAWLNVSLIVCLFDVLLVVVIFQVSVEEIQNLWKEEEHEEFDSQWERTR